MQVLNSWGSFHHATKIWPPVQVCPSCYEALDIPTSLIQIWQVVGNTFLAKFNAYVKVGKKMEISPGEERLWRKALGREMLWESQVQGNISHGLCLLHTKESSLWAKMNREPGCSSLLLLELFGEFSHISWENPEHVCSINYLNNILWLPPKRSFLQRWINLSGALWRVF